MNEKLRVIIEDNTSFGGKIFDYFIQFLIIISIISFSVGTLPDNTNDNPPGASVRLCFFTILNINPDFLITRYNLTYHPLSNVLSWLKTYIFYLCPKLKICLN